MKNISIKLILGIMLVTSMSTFVSCRKSNVDVDHHSESDNVEDNKVDNPSERPTSDKTEMGTPNDDPAGNTASPVEGNGSGKTVPDSIKPLN